MNRADVRDWLHQAALDVARLAEPCESGVPEPAPELVGQGAVGHESLLEAEREARRLVVSTGEPHVVIETRDDQDPPGIEATFMVCPEAAAGAVARGKEIVLRADVAGLWCEKAERAIRHALCVAQRATQLVDIGSDQLVRDLLRDLHRSLIDDVDRLFTALGTHDGGQP